MEHRLRFVGLQHTAGATTAIVACERKGDTDEASEWRQIENARKAM